MPAMGLTFKAKAGSRYSDADARKIGPALMKLAQRGASTADDIVRAASSVGSPLHDYFNWDDAEAAHQYRLTQARSMARSIIVPIIETGGEKREVRAFYAVEVVTSAQPSDPKAQKTYLPITEIRGNADREQQVLDEAIRGLAYWRRRYEDAFVTFPNLQQRLSGVLDAINEVTDEHDAVQSVM